MVLYGQKRGGDNDQRKRMVDKKRQFCGEHLLAGNKRYREINAVIDPENKNILLVTFSRRYKS